MRCQEGERVCNIATGMALGVIEESIPHQWRQIYDSFFNFNSFEHEDLKFTIREIE